MGKNNHNLFALDIGTRKVLGLVYDSIDEGIKIRSYYKKDHHVRSMFDGQIHDILEVAGVVKEVKEKLEKRLNIQLEKGAVAAAGRSLITEKIFVEKSRKRSQRISTDEISILELEGIQQAWNKLQDDVNNNESEYHCVGHSIINYYLNDNPITNLHNQKGDKIGVELIATFLPQVVVDSLEGVMEEIGLKISSLTLEPIAAINLAIPEEIRMLNLALIDIGAGTSDIAITNGGTVIAYQMVPMAGDEITEKICQELLVDFNSAEKIKNSLNKGKEDISYKDVLGVNKRIKKEEIMEFIQETLDKITNKLAETIIEANGSAPSAVFCIGGGSQLPGLEEKLARTLELNKDRVTIKGDEKWDKIKNLRKELRGPHGVTPLGIALSSCKKQNFGFFYITVNDSLIRLFGKDTVKVADALLAAGYKLESLMPVSGTGIKIILNNEEKYFPGAPGEPPQITVNGNNVGLETAVKNNDDICVKEAKPGSSRRLKARELFFEAKPGYFYLDGKKVNFPYEVIVNGTKVLPEKQIHNGSDVKIKTINQVGELVKYLEIDLSEFELWCNNKPLNKTDVIKEGMEVITEKKNRVKKNDDYNNSLNKIKEGTFTGNNKLEVEVNGEKLEMIETKDPRFLDIFKYVNFDTSLKKGELIIKVNGEPAEFTSSIENGDKLEIFWSEEGKKKLERRK